MARISIEQLEGGAALHAWCEDEPVFHDAHVVALSINHGGESHVTANIQRIGPEIDPEGYFVVSKRASVTFTLTDLVEVDLCEFADAIVLDGLEVDADETGVTLSWESAYGAWGRIKARKVSVGFTPVEEAA